MRYGTALQVLQRLATTCSRTSQASPRSQAAVTACALLDALLEETRLLNDVLDLTDTTVNGSMVRIISPADNTSSAVMQSIRAQLLASGVLDSMSGVLTAAAGRAGGSSRTAIS